MASWVGKAWPPATDELPVLLLRAAETVAMAALGPRAQRCWRCRSRCWPRAT